MRVSTHVHADENEATIFALVQYPHGHTLTIDNFNLHLTTNQLRLLADLVKPYATKGTDQ